MPHVHHSAIVTGDLERALEFWRDGLGLVEFFDHEFVGDWPTLFGAESDRLRSVFLGDPARPDSGIVELVVFAGVDGVPAAGDHPQVGFFLLSFELPVEETLGRLAALGFGDGVRRIAVDAPGGKRVPMAVVQAPDGVVVELIGPAV